jgi:hypothetical protein
VFTLRKAIAAIAALCALLLAGTANAGIKFGVADDWAKFHPCGDVFWQSMRDIGYTQLRMTVQWDATAPTVIPYQANIKAAVDCAALNNVNVVLAIYPAKPSAIGSNDAAQQSFAGFVALVGQAFPSVKTFVVGNEPNVNRFWQPQFVNGQDAAAKDYEHTLAYAYDKLKVVRPDSIVWGPAISSRGNDDATATSNPSHSPVMFIAEMAAAYKASGRTKPIFDAFDMHPYPPVQDTAPFSKPFDWPQAGAANLDRIERALYDGFYQTPQWFGGVPINLDEAGEQTDVKSSPHAGAYTYSSPTDNVSPIDETTQANNYVELAHIAECSNLVTSLFYFPLIDDTDILGFQSGQLYADQAHKASYAAMKQEIAASNGGQCHGAVAGVPTTWSTKGVDGASASLVGGFAKPILTTSVSFTVTADEDANYSLSVTTTIADVNVTKTYTGSVKAYRTTTVQVSTGVAESHSSAAMVGEADFTLSAALNPARTTQLPEITFGVKTAQVGSFVTLPQPSVSGSTSSFSSQDPVALLKQIVQLLALPNGAGVLQATQLLSQLAKLLGPMTQSGTASLGLLVLGSDIHFDTRLPAVVAPKKPKLPSLTVKFNKGKTIVFPRLGRIPQGSYQMRIQLVGASGAKLTLQTAGFSVDAKGRMTKLKSAAKAKKAPPAPKTKKKKKTK